MTTWQYFTISGAGRDPLDTDRVAFGRTDLDGQRYNCQTLKVDRGWARSDLLERYHLLGSNDKVLTDLTDAQAAHLITVAVESGRFGDVAPELPGGADGSSPSAP